MSVIVWGLAYASLNRLRISEPELHRSYRCWGYPFTGYFLVACSAVIFLGFAWRDGLSLAVIVGILAVSYLVFRRVKR